MTDCPIAKNFTYFFFYYFCYYYFFLLMINCFLFCEEKQKREVVISPCGNELKYVTQKKMKFDKQVSCVSGLVCVGYK